MKPERQREADRHTDTDRIEKKILLRATRSRVREALTDARKFGSRFGVAQEGPFVAGAEVHGVLGARAVDPGENPHDGTVSWIVDRIEPQHRFSLRWHPFTASEEGLASSTALGAGAGVTRQAIAKHLRVLERAGLVRGSRRGRESIWELEAKSLEVARSYLEQVAQRWDGALSRLRTSVEA